MGNELTGLRRTLWLWSLLLLEFSPAIAQTQEEKNILYATSDGGTVVYKGKSIKSHTLRTAMKKARGGDTVYILPGTYRGEHIFEKTGEDNNPIIIRGTPDLSIFSCNKMPTKTGKAVITIVFSKWIVIQDLSFKDCWPSAIEIKNSEFITIKNINVSGSYYPITATEPFTHHIAMEEILWIPDPSNEAWRTKPTLYDGALFFGQNIAGGLIFRKNTLKVVHDGMYLKSDLDKPKYPDNIMTDGNIVEEMRGQLLVMERAGTSGDYPKRPIVTTVEFKPKSITITFSENLKVGTSNVALAGKMGQKELSCKTEKQTLHCPMDGTPFREEEVEKIILPANLAGKDGALITLWGSISPKISLRKPRP